MTKRPSLSLLLAATACGGSPAPAPETGPPTPSSTPAPPPVSTAEPTAEAPAPAPSPFHVIGELPVEVQIFGAGERGFVAAEAGIVFSLVGDDVVHDPLVQRGFIEDPMFALAGITGTWPDGAWLSTTHPSGRSGFTKLWTWDGKRWVKRQTTSDSHFIMGIRPWTGGRQLAVEQHGMIFDARFRIVSGDKNATVPVITKRSNPASFCYSEIRVEAFETLPTGEVFIAGPRCNDEEVTSAAVERWAPGKKNGVIESLPGSSIGGHRTVTSHMSIHVTGMIVRSANDVLVAAEKNIWDTDAKTDDTNSYIAHFDGSRWQEQSSNVPGSIKTLSASSDGTLFATNGNGELYTGRDISALSRVPLPPELSTPGSPSKPQVDSLWVHAPGDVWAIVAMRRPSEKGGGHADARYLLHTRPGSKPLPTIAEFEEKERAYRLPGPPVDWCRTPFVLLYTLGKKAPKDYDYPSTRAALKGHEEFAKDGVEFLEFERLGSRFFGARVPDFDIGDKLAKLVKEKVPGSTPELVCHDPPPLRALSIDLAPAAKK